MDFHISSLLPEIPTAQLRPKISNQRQYILSLFVEKLNSERGGRKPLNGGFIAMRMGAMKRIDDLYAFFDKCSKSRSFSECWWYETDPKKHPLAKKNRWGYN